MATKTPQPEKHQSPETQEVTHHFTPAQAESVASLFNQIESAQGNLNFFLNHIVREAKLPPAEGQGYRLTDDRKGLTGTVRSEDLNGKK